MPTTNPPKILLTGTTGFIGGTILTTLLSSPSPHLKNLTITCLIRGPDRAHTLTSTYGSRVHPVLYNDLNDLETTTAIAAQHDIVISTTLGYHLPSAEALLKGLKRRKEESGNEKEVWMLHLSGTSNVAGFPITGAHYEPTRSFDDTLHDIYAYEKTREEESSYIQRTTELGVVDLGLELGVKTVVLMPPTVYGMGTGLFNKYSIQIPTYIRGAIDVGKAVVVAEGRGRNGSVHVEDLADLYCLLLSNILSDNGNNIPTGKKGILFAENGNHTWREVAELVGEALHARGKLDSQEVRSVTLSEGTKIFASYLETVDEKMVESGLCGDSRTVASVARGLGWVPRRGEEAWKKGVREDVGMVLEILGR
ncbi:NAD dependent epimerase/dehydratase family protein [Lophiotrema nucula]|uniref:NAD dependent epimerase/dehydratase family protein n=1 Tax=Lophiotrema nucula TaxID=690887 RepID=A0A6A5YKS6_9PLEO|nr:NAD dependent epimerase/dehydratase family protein [Lophiotrema nucula]